MDGEIGGSSDGDLAGLGLLGVRADIVGVDVGVEAAEEESWEAEEVEEDSKAFLIMEEEKELRLVVFGDENSKRSVSNVVRIVVE